MKKKLVYTVSDLEESSIGCIHLLYNSLLLTNSESDFDFLVITNNKAQSNLNRQWMVVKVECTKTFVGWARYFDDVIPTGYENYYYFDSDILCYESLDNLKSFDSEFSFMFEEGIISTDWHLYPFSTESEIKEFKKNRALNSGTFVFKNLELLKEVRCLFNKFDFNTKSSEKHAQFEQSCFNYVVYKKYLNRNIFRLDELIKLFPEELTSHNIYHFCGFTGNMNSKYERMMEFDKIYRRKILLNYLQDF